MILSFAIQIAFFSSSKQPSKVNLFTVYAHKHGQNLGAWKTDLLETSQS